MKNKNSLISRNLDNSAKVYSVWIRKKYSSVFRLSVVLKEDIQPKFLQEAVIESLEKYHFFKVRLRKRLLGYYLEYNSKTPIVEEERGYPCKYIEPVSNREYLFKVTYLKNKINIDIYHVLTDANSGTLFFNEIIYTYLEKCYSNELKKEKSEIKKIDFNTEDSYIKNFDKNVKSKQVTTKAYKLQGKKIKLGAISCIDQIINLEQLKKETEKHKVTITQYLATVLLYCIYNENYIKNNGKDSINMYIPVDLKKYFPSKTITNFFSYITIQAKVSENNLNTFEKILEFVKKSFEEQLQKEEIIKIISNNVKIVRNRFMCAMPLFLKKIITRLLFLEIRKYSTITYSNIGKINIAENYKKYIEYFKILISPDMRERLKCSSCAYENNMVFSFTSILDDNKIEMGFYRFLTEKGIDVKIESNGVLM